MNKILLLSATDLEHNTKKIGPNKIHITGLGKISAAHRTTELILKYDPEVVINFGSCGNLKNFKVGEVLEVGTVFNNIDARPLAGYGETPFEGINEIKFNPDSSIKCFSTDQFYHKSNNTYREEYKKMIKKCDIVDMELYAIAWCCMKMKKRLHSFKWVSDNGDSEQWDSNADLGFNRFQEIIRSKFI